jgi:hypothetical protein
MLKLWMVDPHGEVSPCCGAPFNRLLPIGNAFEEPLTQIERGIRPAAARSRPTAGPIAHRPVACAAVATRKGLPVTFTARRCRDRGPSS